MHSNGTMFAHWFIAEGGRGYESPFEAGWYMYAMPTTLLTIRTNPQATTLQTVSAKNVTREVNATSSCSLCYSESSSIADAATGISHFTFIFLTCMHE